MDKQKLERAKNIESLLSKLNSVDFWSRNKNTTDILGNYLYHLCYRDKEFGGKLHQLISETINRLKKELDEL